MSNAANFAVVGKNIGSGIGDLASGLTSPFKGVLSNLLGSTTTTTTTPTDSGSGSKTIVAVVAVVVVVVLVAASFFLLRKSA